MPIDAYTLTSLAAYKSYAGINDVDLRRDAFSVYGSDGTAATVAKSGNTLTLVKTGGATPGTTNINLAAAAYDTLTELVAYINTIAGWVANLTGTAGAASADLVNIPATSCLGSGNSVTLEAVDNYALEQLINQASADIESYLGRKVLARAYTNERHDGRVDGLLFLRNPPVSSVSRVSVGVVGAIRVKYDLATAYSAHVRVTSSGVELYLNETKAATLEFATYATMTALAAAINAVSNWTAELTSETHAAWPSSFLFEHSNRYCRDSWAELEVPDQPVEYVEEDAEAGIIKVWQAGGFQNVFAGYNGGWSTAPADIVLACHQFVKYLDDQRRQDLSMRSETLGDYSYSRASLEQAVTPEALRALSRYRMPRFAE